MTTTVFHVSDMHCVSCQNRIRTGLVSIAGVAKVRANPISRELFVDHDEHQAPVIELFGIIEKLGFNPLLGNDDNKELRSSIKRLGVAAICMMQVMMQAIALYLGAHQEMAVEHVRLLQIASFVFCLPVVFYSAQPFFASAWSSIRGVRKAADLFDKLSMDVPVSLALVIAFSSSTLTLIRGYGEVYFDSVVMFTFLLLCSRFIEKRLMAHRSAASAVSVLPEKCIKVSSHGDVSIAVSDLKIGDRVLVRPGDQVVADGVVSKGIACLDESLLTGESDAVTRKPGEPVTAGSNNYHQPFEFSVTHTGSNSRLAQIQKMTDEALAHRPTAVIRANRIASYFVSGLLLVALMTCLFWLIKDAAMALPATIAVLVVSCPCALALATPAAINAGLTTLQRQGVLVRNSEVLETASRLKGIVFDKTGTLTTGKFSVCKIDQLGEFSASRCLTIAASLERGSPHPIARAFDSIDPCTVDRVTIDPNGVSGETIEGMCRIGTRAYCLQDSNNITRHQIEHRSRHVWLSVNGCLVAKFYLQEQWRRDIDSIINGFKFDGLETILLSGDSSSNCEPFVSRLSVLAGHSPEEKHQALIDFQQSLGPVLMLGDGINDLPALAQADLSASVLEAPEVVKATSDILLLSRQLQPIRNLVRMSLKVKKVIRQNIAWAVAYNLVMIPLAISGLLHPWMAALGMSVSSLLVVLNATRLNRRTS